MNKKYLNYEQIINKELYKKVNEILLILKIKIIKNNNLELICKNIFNDIYKHIVDYIFINMNQYDSEQIINNIENIVQNINRIYKL